MRNSVIVLLAALSSYQSAWAQDSGNQEAEAAVRARIQTYVETFNGNDAAAVAGFWTRDAVSLNEETGDRTVGRDALQQEFASFFDEHAKVSLAGRVDRIRTIRPDVVMAEGEVTLVAADREPVTSAFTTILVKENDQWMIDSCHERELPTPATAYDALKDLEWLVGSWRDRTEEAQVDTTVRWSPSRAFLIRSFNAQIGEEESFQGTQVIGWDPRHKSIRTWTFYSDGSFGDGVMSRNGDEWIVKMTHMLSDGRLGTATQVIKRIDDDTVEVQKIGETIDGEPVPAANPIVVVRTAGADTVTVTGVDTAEEGGTP